jgi:hypothetical protein
MQSCSHPPRRDPLRPARSGDGHYSPARQRRAPALGAVLLASLAGPGLMGIAASRAAGASTGAASTGAGVAHEAANGRATPRGGTPVLGRAARTLSVRDEGHLHLVSNSGSNLIEEGPISGTLPGRVRVSFNVGPTVYASFTIYVQGGGTISGRGHGALHSTSAYSTFGGSLSVTHGTGRYAHASGTGGLYGAINRRSSSYPMTVQTVGELHY